MGVRWRTRTCIVALITLTAARVASAQCAVPICVLVNNTSDILHASCGVNGVGTCSLRDAITIGLYRIEFSIGTGHQTITLMSNLPDLGGGTIDATTQPGWAGAPLIELRRGDSGTATHGLRKSVPTSANQSPVIIKGLVINHFNGGCTTCGGIIFADPADVVKQGGNVVQGCYIGTDWTGTVADPNIPAGIVDNSDGDNTIGGLTAAERNVISGNSEGIEIARRGSGYSVQDVIQGNYIGLNAAGTAAIPNANGILVGPPYPGFSPGVLIGGSAPGARNVISGNGNGILLNEGINNLIQGNFIGLDATGLNLVGNSTGITLQGETTATIANNVFAVTANGGAAGITLSQEPVTNIPTTGAKIQGNYIGTDMTGNHALPSPGAVGIWIELGAPNNLIGGSVAGQGNVIGGFHQGIYISGGGAGLGSSGNVIKGNRIGVGVNDSPISNRTGIAAWSVEGKTVIGGEGPAEGNIIVFNGTGISVQNGAGNTIRGNSILLNQLKGIDFFLPLASVPYPNRPGSPHTGPNLTENFPLLTAVSFPDSLSVRVQGTINSKPASTVIVDFYANLPPLHPADFLQGAEWLGAQRSILTDSAGNAAFDEIFPAPDIPNIAISMTATDDQGNTSEFSQRSLFSISPNRGPAATNIGVALQGQLFQPGATVKFGPTLMATGVNVSNPNQISALTPFLAAGSLYDVTVTNPDASTAVMKKAFMVDFNDVPYGSGLYRFVMSLASDGVTAGCGNGNYCPSLNVTRAQMAVFLLIAEHGASYIPPTATGTVFTDVLFGAFAAGFIEQLFHEGVTGGCGGGNYCPANPVTRAQMAVFLLRTRNGPSYTPPACTTPTFADVPCSSPFARWVDELAARGITAGCGGGNYCPSDPVTRGQMAVFLTATFALP